MLIERELIPDDVTIVVLTQAREHLSRKTYECLKGCKRAIVHFATSVAVREGAGAVCNAVLGVLTPTPAHPMLINRPATVEMTTPNVFADQELYDYNNLDDRDDVLLTLHPHNYEGM